MKNIYGFVLCLLLCGCPEVCELANEFCPKPEPVPPIVTPVPVPTSTPVVTVTPAPVPTIKPTAVPVPTSLPQDITDTFLDGNEGNLWKPESDNTGNTVVLLHKKYSQEMDSCSIELKNGNKESLLCQKGSWNNYSCFANGDRQHWRSAKSCKDIKSTKTVCKKGGTTLTVTGGNDPCKRHD